MGIAFALVFGAVIGVVLAIKASALLTSVTTLLTRGRGSRKLLAISAALPFASLAWLAGVFVIQAVINVAIFDRDPGIGDSWHCPLPVGYAIEMIDVADYGSLVPKQVNWPVVSGVHQLQISGQYLLGDTDSKAFEHFGTTDADVGGYFVLDAMTGSVKHFSTLRDLSTATKQYGITVKLEPIAAVYFRYRHTWVDYSALILAVVPPVLAFRLLCFSICSTRRKQLTLSPQ